MAKRRSKQEVVTETIAEIPIVHPDPIERQREPELSGVPVVMGDGKTWILAYCGLAKGLAAVRDRMFDSLVVYEEVDTGDLLQACFYALRINYDVTDDELASLIRATAPGSIVDEVSEAIIPTMMDEDRTYTDWARSALLANGVKPADIPARDLKNVLDQLLMTGRAIPLAKFVESARHAAARATIRSLIPARMAEVVAMQATE